MPRHCYVLRVFTRDGAGGNSLGVVTDILGLDDAKMQQIATDLGFSETIFLSWFEGTMPKARIFTPTVELPYRRSSAGGCCLGSASISGPSIRAAIECSVGTGADPPGRRADLDRRRRGSAGQNRVARSRSGTWLARILTSPRCSCRLPYLLVQVGTPGEVAAVGPSMVAGFGEVYVWAWDGGRPIGPGPLLRPRLRHRARTRPPAAPRSPLLRALRDLGQRSGALVIHQGEEMGHPSRINLVWDGDGTSIGGTVARDEVRFLKL